jgi:hypothetical protein
LRRHSLFSRRLEAPADASVAALLAALVIAADLQLNSRFLNFDGIACAIAVESRNIRHLAHGNHVLYGLLGLAFDASWRALGYTGRSLLPLQVMDRLLHAACAAATYILLRQLRASRAAAALGAAGLSMSFVVWFYGLEAHVYLLGLLGLLGASICLFGRQVRPVEAGLCHAFAIGGHVTHALFLPCALYWLWTIPGRRRGAMQRYLASLAAGTFAVYAVGFAAVRPTSLSALARWLYGTAAIGPGRVFHWHGSWAPLTWCVGAVGALWAQEGQTSFYVSPGPLFAVHAAAYAALAAAAFLSSTRHRRLAAAMGVWVLAYFLFFSTWEPENMNYHVAELIPLWALTALCLDERGRIGRTALAASVSAVAASSWLWGIGPMTRPGSNPRLAEMEAVRAATPEDAWVATAADIGQVYVPYFAGRKPLILSETVNRPDAFELKEPVYALPELLNDPTWKARLASSFKLEPVPAGAFTLYRLERR